MSDTAAIVVTYNRKKLLSECIKKLKEQTEKVDIIIIDNMSTDGTSEMLKSLEKSHEIIYHATGKNIGGAGGFHEGIKLAYRLGYKFFWLMDDDCLPTKDALKNLKVIDKKIGGNYGFLCSKVLWIDNNICKMNIPKISISKKVEDFNSEIVPIKMGTFVSFYLKREVVKEIGLPIKEFFIWGDDLEYSQRISNKYPSYLVNTSVVVHKTKNNSGSNIAIDDFQRINRYRLAYRNEVVLFREAGFKEKVYQYLRLGLHIERVISKAPDHKWQRLTTIFIGTKDGHNFHPRIDYIE
ncbi:glycosyltransferase family 2 protein [Lactobacillus agrestimuris]|uniref:glycosyltransferase family 2 protein n=1 Tax=Lactobacillus agrestimuris TaxID=2941328 RepID=UPI0020437B67|nr:glycosyltransferase family 2 protein [Lactobacillus agrestimuris]